MARCATCLRLHHSDFLLVTPPLLLLLLGQFDNLFAATREELYFALDAIRSQLALVIDLRVTADRLDVHNANVQEARDTNTFADVDTTLRVRTCRFTTRAVCVPHAPPLVLFVSAHYQLAKEAADNVTLRCVQATVCRCTACPFADVGCACSSCQAQRSNGAKPHQRHRPV